MYTVKSVFEKEAREMRAVYCETLQQLARENDRIAVLDADLVGSSGTKPFFNEFPDRAIDCGIQENNMIGVAAGMSAAGMIPFAHSFGPFASRRCVDQIFISCAYAKLNVRIVGSDPGVTAAYNGGTHMPFEDMGALMSIPQITLLEPTDSVQLRWMIRQLEKEYGVYYIRMLRKNAVGVFEEGSDFELGKIARLKEGADVAIVCSGILVGEALKAAAALEAPGSTPLPGSPWMPKPWRNTPQSAAAWSPPKTTTSPAVWAPPWPPPWPAPVRSPWRWWASTTSSARWAPRTSCASAST